MTKDLRDAVLDVATWPPAKRSRNAVSAAVPWHMIERLRSQLVEEGYNWRQVQIDERIDERRAARDWLLPHERDAKS